MITSQNNQAISLYVSDSNDPYYNLAFEEFLATNIFIKNEIPIIFLWRNNQTIVIGKNQLADFEINLDLAKKDNVKIVKRLSGGGTVFHDLGNFCFSFIVKNEKQAGNYSLFLEPIIKFLKTYHLDAHLSGKNDLTINDIKVSGNAQYIENNVLVHHGTLLFDTNLNAIKKYLKLNLVKLETKVQLSQVTSIANIKEFMDSPINTEDFFKEFINFFKLEENITYYEINNDLLIVKNLVNDKYKKNEWTFNHPFNLEKMSSIRFGGGTISLWINQENNIINKILFEGDFLATKNHEIMLNKFIGVKIESSRISKILDQIDIPKFFGKITKQELLSLFFPI